MPVRVNVLRGLIGDHGLRRTIARNGYRKACSRQWWDERSDFIRFLQCLAPVSDSNLHRDEEVTTTVTSRETMAVSRISLRDACGGHYLWINHVVFLLGNGERLGILIRV